MLFRINRRVLKPLSSRMFTVPAKLQIEDTDIMTYVLAQLDDATEHLDTIKFSKLSENWYSLFRNCHSVIKFNLPIKKDNGRNMMVETYLAQHRCYISPYNCRMRITPEINIRKLEALAIHESIKSACHGIPFGGAKGGIKLDKSKVTTNELRRTCIKYISSLVDKKFVGSGVGIISPDLGSSKIEMDWMYNAYRTLYSHTDPNFESAVIGKSPSKGGVDGFIEATGLGI